MAAVILTNALISKVLKGDRNERQTLRDAAVPGLRLVVGPQRAVFAFTYTVRSPDGRKDREVRLGHVPEVSLSEARVQAEKLKLLISAGRDPAGERKAAATNAVTLAAAAAAWQPHGRAGHVANEKANVRLAIAEMELGAGRPDAVGRRDLAKLVEMHRDKAVVARQRLGALRRFYDHLVIIGAAETNPVRALPAQLVPKPPQSRSHYPTAAEVQALWRGAEALPEPKGAFLRASLLLPLRRTELACLTADEVDVSRRVITLAAGRTKSNRAFELPFGEEAVALLQPRLAGLAPEERLFALSHTTPMQAWSKYLIQIRKASGVEGFALHDTRRLFASECSEHGLGDIGDIDGLLNHAQSGTRSGVLAVYDRSARRAQRAAIMRRWGETIAYAVEHGHWPREVAVESTVVSLPMPRR